MQEVQEMRLNYVDVKSLKDSNGQKNYTLDSLTETEFLQSLSDEKRKQVQGFNAQQSLVRDQDQTELDIMAYQSGIDQTKKDKIMLIYIHDKTESYDYNSRAFESVKSRNVDIMLPYFIDRIQNISDMYSLVCHTLKLQSVNPVAMTAISNFIEFKWALKRGKCFRNWYRILDLRDLLIDQTSESQRAFRDQDDDQWQNHRFLARLGDKSAPLLLFAPQTLGNIRAGQLEGETLLIWDSNGEDYVDDDSIESEVSKILHCKDETMVVIPQKINLSSSENIDRLFESQTIVQNQYKLDLVDFLSLGENVKTMKKLFHCSKFEFNKFRGDSTVGSGYKATLFIDVGKLKNLKSMNGLCMTSFGLDNIEIVNLRPGISMHNIIADSEVSSIRLTGSINADDIATLFEVSNNIRQIDLSNLTINTSTDPEELKKQMVKIFWRITSEHAKLIISSDTYNRAPWLFKTLKRQRKLDIKIV